ncbi:MAG: Uma2 family endonuclease [Bacteroidota bacterium]
MTVATAQQPTTDIAVKEKISWENFQEEYLTREDEYKYEWVDGYVEKTIREMNKTQFYIQANLNRFLYGLRTTLGFQWHLIAEGDTFFVGHHRRPDIAFYTTEQLEAAKANENVVPQFIIEVISTNDNMNAMDSKMDDYRAAEVPVIWHIFPTSKKVHVYQGKQMLICEGEDLCSATAVIPGFELPVAAVFK